MPTLSYRCEGSTGIAPRRYRSRRAPVSRFTAPPEMAARHL